MALGHKYSLTRILARAEIAEEKHEDHLDKVRGARAKGRSTGATRHGRAGGYPPIREILGRACSILIEFIAIYLVWKWR